jgi:hypothetical protein
VIRLVAAAGLALLATGCASGEPAAFVPEPPPTVAPMAPTVSSAPQAAEEVVANPVPPSALLSPADLGAGWAKAAPQSVPCRTGLARTPSRSGGLQDARGTLTETVSTGAGVVRSVAAWRRALGSCGWSVSDYRLGDAGLSALSADRSARVVVTGTEGVLVVLHAGGGLAGAADEMDGWADMALGTSCPAAPDGCH